MHPRTGIGVNDRGQPLFLERESYRRRRLIDAARLLPVLGFLALCLPILWPDGRFTSVGVIYLFVVWICLIAVARLLVRRLGKADADRDEADK